MKEKGEGNEYIFVLKSILEISNGGIYVLNFFIKRLNAKRVLIDTFIISHIDVNRD